MPAKNTKRILVAPLDWGLGHSSRCLPLITYLRGLGHEVVVAGNTWQRSFLSESCPGIKTIHLEGYNVAYSKKAGGFMFSMFRQLPKILASIRQEHHWLAEEVAKHPYDGIISDNRYGLFHQKVPSVIMTHQLSVRTGLGNAVDEMLRRLHYKYLRRFPQCWVVDAGSNANLGGKLSHPKSLPENAGYMGLLSQFRKKNTNGNQHLLVLLSGPEPQRTLLSDILWEQVQAHKGAVVFVEGSDEINARTGAAAHISYHLRLATEQLQPLLEEAGIVICRSGYSTLMDLVALGKRAIVIPTPGQTEQGYLASHLHRAGVFFSCRQKNFNLREALLAVDEFPFKQLTLQHSFDIHQEVLNKWLETI
ncbi:MAG: glycosyl transferase family 28 [Flavipsychrobacter sp.]|nr:glycosyl transferase family 28 [Flavipsychrobacter sp.]